MRDAAPGGEICRMGSGLRALRRKEGVAVAGGLLALLLLTLWLALPRLIAVRWTAQLRAAGYPQAELAIDELGWGRAGGAFSLGGDAGADRFDAVFTPMGLWRGRLSALTVRGLRLSRPLPLAAPDLPAAMPVDGPLELTGARLDMELPGGLGVLPVTLDARLVPVDGGWQAAATGELGLGPVRVPVRATLEWRGDIPVAASVAFTPVAGGPHLTGGGSARRLSDGRWTGDLMVDATGLPQGMPDLSLRWNGGQGQALLEWKDVARLDALLDPEGPGTACFSARLRIADLSAFADRLNRPDPGLAGGPVEIDLSASGFTVETWPRVWPDLSVRLEANGIGVGRGPRDNSLSLAAVARRIDGLWWLAPVPDHPGRLSVPTLGLEARGLLLTGRAALPLDLDLRAAGLRLPWLAPSSLSAKLRGDPASDLRLEWQAVTGDGGATLSGGLDLDPDGGQLVARMAPLQLNPGDARRLFPGAPLPAGFTGTIAARVAAGWTVGGLEGAADILLEDTGIDLPGLRLAGVNGVLRFDRLSPLSLPQQTLAVGLFDPGLALTGGGLGLFMPGDGVLRLAPEPFLWAGQRVTIPPVSFRIGNEHLDLSLNVPPTPLADALSSLGVTGMTAQGTLTGSLPVRIDAGGARPGPSGLFATGPGRLALTDGDPPLWLDPARNDSLSLVARALADYRYAALELVPTQRGPRLSLQGANPALYGGYAMPMNLNLAMPPPVVPPPVTPAVRDAIAAFKARRD